MTTRLAREIGRLLRNEREKRDWTQRRLAREANTAQQYLSRIERGTVAARLDTIERLFAVLGWQPRFGLEILDDELGDQIARVGQVDDQTRVSAMWHFQWYLGKSRGLPYVVEGQLGALLHGVPLETETLSIAVAEADLDRLADWILTTPPCLRWNEKWEDYGGNHPDPRRPGAMRWKLGIGDLRVNLVPQLPEPVRIRVGDADYPVRPLDQIADADPGVARVIARVRERIRK